MRISFSAFDSYNSCPLKYKFQYVDRIKVPKKVELEFGSLMHSVVELALKRDPIVPPIEELVNFFDENFAKISFPDDLQKKQYSSVGKDMIRVFHDSLTPGLRSTIATEKRFYLDLNEKHSLSGVIDRIDKLPFGAFEVIDYKTSFKLKTQDEVNRDKQLGVYKIAVEHFWPEAEDVRLSMYFLRPNLKLTTTRHNEESDDLKKEIIETCEKIQAETEFKPKKNPLCDWCDFQHLCPLYRGGDSLEIDQTIFEYIQAQENLKNLEAKIHQHFDEKKVDTIEHKKGILTRNKNKIIFKKA